MIGRRVSHFYIIRSLGSGGMGVVYEAQDTRLPRSVAIKFLKPAQSTDADAIKRFRREARLASSLNHPNICTILDIDDGPGEQSFIAMELLQGRSLKARLADGPLSLDEIVDIARQVATALAAAHSRGIMHRDLTPGNIFLTTSGLVKLLDFGLAKHLATLDGDDTVSDDLTAAGTVAGTIHYMAPEQFSDADTVDFRCDLFSFGAVLYQMATGARPFEAASKSEVMALIQNQPHLPMRQLAPQHPARLERLIDTLLAKRPDDRYQTAQAVRAEFDLLQSDAPALVTDATLADTAGPSIAVLPFKIIGPVESRSEQFRDGLVEDLCSILSGVPNLRVAPRTSARPVPGEMIRDLGKRLQVKTVLEGSVQHVDDRVRVIANLIDAEQERSVRPAINVERRFGALLTVQHEIAREIVDGLAATFVRSAGAQHTGDSEAFHAFKRGLHHFADAYNGGWRPAIEQFDYAIARDPRFALAHVGLAAAYNFLAFNYLMKPNLAFDVAGQAARRALAIDDTLAAAHAELASAKFGRDWDWEGAEQEFRRALSLDPSAPLIHAYYSWLLMLLGRRDAALAEAEAARALAPSHPMVTTARAHMFYLARHYDEAIALCTESLQLVPGHVFSKHVRGLCYLCKKMGDEAIADLEDVATRTGRSPFFLALLGLCYGEFGMTEQARGLVDELDRLAAGDTYVHPQCYVFVYTGLDEGEKAAVQERAYQDGASPLSYLAPYFRELYAVDPHYAKRLEQMRLIP